MYIMLVLFLKKMAVKADVKIQFNSCLCIKVVAAVVVFLEVFVVVLVVC